MTFDLARILEAKHAQRRRLAARPIGEKLHLLDAMRARAIALRGSTFAGAKVVRGPGDVRSSAAGEGASSTL